MGRFDCYRKAVVSSQINWLFLRGFYHPKCFLCWKFEPFLLKMPTSKFWSPISQASLKWITWQQVDEHYLFTNFDVENWEFHSNIRCKLRYRAFRRSKKSKKNAFGFSSNYPHSMDPCNFVPTIHQMNSSGLGSHKKTSSKVQTFFVEKKWKSFYQPSSEDSLLETRQRMLASRIWTFRVC